MPRRPFVPVLFSMAMALVAGAAAPALAQAPAYDGFLCCNMQSDGSWISDINYRSERSTLVPAGTPVRVTGLGRWRVLVEIDGKKQAIGNDYSRSIALEEFARRYVLAEDPRPLMAAYPEPVRAAIQAGKVARGMTRAQVVMAIGHPIASYNSDLEQPIWRYWLDRSTEYQVFWGADGRVERVFGAPAARARVAVE